MTNLEYLEKLMAEKDVAAKNLKTLYELQGEREADTNYRKAVVKYDALDKKCETILDAFIQGTLNPQDEVK